jgi:3-deoxy-D-manno-octulosonic-acid transferase
MRSGAAEGVDPQRASRPWQAVLARAVYVVLSYALAPFALGFLAWRGLWNRAYWERFGERLGFTELRCATPSIWIHAVSVGEVQASAPLVRAILAEYPQTPVVVSTTTPTGAQRVQALFHGNVAHVYAPYDTPGSMRRFFERIRPRLVVIIETELWPNLFHECGRRRVPLVLASARISPRSLGSYRRFTALFREALSHGIVIAAQSEADAERFGELGAACERTHVTGNIKFDFETPAQVRDRAAAFRTPWLSGRPVWVAASTHGGEDEQVLDAFEEVRRVHADCLLLIAPRHPERFAAVAALVRAHGLGFVTRSSGAPCDAKTQVFLLDTLGELPAFYAAASVAFVGGSLVPVGGHNLLEPAALGVPIITGPYNFNAQEVADMLVAAGGASRLRNGAELGPTVIELLDDPALRERCGQIAQRFVQDNRGALERLLALVRPLLDAEPCAGAASAS